MANHTVLNTTIANSGVGVAEASSLFFTVVIPALFARLWDFVATPFIYLDMWWLLIHLVLTFVLFELYFDRHQQEDLGWQAALANSIVMIFISMELLRAMYHHEGSPFSVIGQIALDYWRLGLNEAMFIVTLIIVLGLFGIATAVINYYHFLPRSVAFLISGHKTVNLLAYFLMVVVWRYTHGNPIPLDMITITALILFGVILWGLLFLVNRYFKNMGPPPQQQGPMQW